jgi:hypothetical protein
MSNGNVAIVEAAVRAFEQDAVQAISDYFADDIDHRAVEGSIETNFTYAVLYTIRDGKIAKGREYLDREKALTAARMAN